MTHEKSRTDKSRIHRTHETICCGQLFVKEFTKSKTERHGCLLLLSIAHVVICLCSSCTSPLLLFSPFSLVTQTMHHENTILYVWYKQIERVSTSLLFSQRKQRGKGLLPIRWRKRGCTQQAKKATLITTPNAN